VRRLYFRFAVKVPRAITHDGELAPIPRVLDQFGAEVQGLGRKLGVLLVQLPPTLAFDAPMARRFFRELRKRVDVPIACEPRHPSWGSHRAVNLLIKCAVARVAADPSPWPGADQPGGYEGLAYFSLARRASKVLFRLRPGTARIALATAGYCQENGHRCLEYFR
jgi:uncharacterized protein YecE (DUF72 family)